mmetsp:Transcript_101279/g.285537  ORF Transcript_101279/g.285537 Transcript_101279/m.285537 type:complete len:322 (+) Transcript_101279:74-1039(+)
MRCPLRRVVPLVTVATVGAVSAEDEWLSFPSPGGAWLVHKDCVHHLDADFHVESSGDGGDVLSHAGRRVELPQCRHAPRRPNALSPRASSGDVESPSYYSDWAAYAQYTHKGGLGYMSSDWTVPPAPESTGPVPGMSSTYFFNGLENSGGVPGIATFILQPVLSYGKSGCIVNPLNFFHWYLTSFHVTQAGRAYCGSRLPVEEGERLRGVMRLGQDNRTWTVESTRLVSNETSTYSVDLQGATADTAYLTLETMINYGCEAFPPSDSLAFSGNALADEAGEKVSPVWQRKVDHTECSQGVSIGSDGSVTITWDSHRALAIV